MAYILEVVLFYTMFQWPAAVEAEFMCIQLHMLVVLGL